MCIIYKKIRAIIGMILIVGILPAYAVDGDELLRKGLGILGTGMVVHGIVKLARRDVCGGLNRMLAGTCIAVGGICSDIILCRCVTLISRYVGSCQQEDRSVSGDLLTSLRHVRDSATDLYQGPCVAAGNRMQSENQVSRAKRSFEEGSTLTGVVLMYDGAYHALRGYCRRLLYRQ